jgi:dynein heavy chain
MEKTEKEISMLTRLYDLYTTVLSTIDNYADILWTDVVASIDTMSEQVSQFQAQCKKLPKALRDWPAYTDCRKKIDDFLEILPLLQALSSPDMRERHWVELGRIAGVVFDLSPDTFKLVDLLSANMLRVTEDVEDLSTAAIKEAQVETKLRQIETEWSDQVFSFGTYKSRGTVTLAMAPTAELIEKLEVSISHPPHSASLIAHTRLTFSFLSLRIRKWRSGAWPRTGTARRSRNR